MYVWFIYTKKDTTIIALIFTLWFCCDQFVKFTSISNFITMKCLTAKPFHASKFALQEKMMNFEVQIKKANQWPMATGPLFALWWILKFKLKTGFVAPKIGISERPRGISEIIIILFFFIYIHCVWLIVSLLDFW